MIRTAKTPTSRQAKPDAISLLAAMATPAAVEPRLKPSNQGVRGQQARTGARAGTRQIAGHFPEETVKALKFVMAEEATTLQALLDEAIHDLLVKKGRAKLQKA